MKKYKMKYDIHTHTVFSHGKGTIEDNVKVALEKGLERVGISDHGSGHLLYGIKKSSLGIMREEIDRLRAIYPQIRIDLGIEANIMDLDGTLDIGVEELTYLDYVLAGYHYGVLGKNPLKATGSHISNFLNLNFSKSANTDRIIAALYGNEISILTHPGDKGPVDIFEIAKACHDTDTLMEISTWHSHLTVEEIRICAKTEVKFVISSDAHSPERVGTFQGGLSRAIEAGLDMERIDNIEVCEFRD
ncbi:MAG: PHP domain-containing protein [Anaerovoracaceae bacterium]|jgi:putative hydrolase